jgi:hypothetical protein
MDKEKWCSHSKEELSELKGKYQKADIHITLYKVGAPVIVISGAFDGYDRNIIVKEFMKAYRNYKISLSKTEPEGQSVPEAVIPEVKEEVLTA